MKLNYKNWNPQLLHMQRRLLSILTQAEVTIIDDREDGFPTKPVLEEEHRGAKVPERMLPDYDLLVHLCLHSFLDFPIIRVDRLAFFPHLNLFRHEMVGANIEVV